MVVVPGSSVRSFVRPDDRIVTERELRIVSLCFLHIPIVMRILIVTVRSRRVITSSPRLINMLQMAWSLHGLQAREASYKQEKPPGGRVP